MIKIRALRSSELKQVLSLLNQYSDRESEYSVLQKMQQLYIPVHRLSLLMPLNMQFMPAIFIAAAESKVLGLIWLSPDGRHYRRWKIDHLILDPDSSSYDVGTQLVHYVINRYGGEGVQTFIAYVDQYHTSGLALLKTCGFRRCGRLHYFSHQNPGVIKLSDDPAKPLVVHGVQHVFHPPLRLDSWPDGKAETRLVFIVRDIPKAVIEDLFNAFTDQLASADVTDRTLSLSR